MVTEIIGRLAPHAQSLDIHPATLLGLILVGAFVFLYAGLKILA